MNFSVLIKGIVIIVAIAMTQNLFANDARPTTDTSQKTVLITGASSGIGRKTTEYLASHGYFVYAGARKEEDLIDLNKIANVQSIHLDVTRQDDIDNAVKTITQNGRGLYGLVNNAGVNAFGPLTEIEEKDFNFVMDVNVYGPYRITKAFSPLLIESKGRIIMIGSLFGTISTMPLMGPYAMSKHAIEAYTDTLAAEMAPYGVKVSVIEPGTYKSEIYRNSYNRAIEEQKDNNTELADWQKQLFAKGPTEHDNYPPPDKVAETVSLALLSKKPKARYLVVPDAQQAKSTIKAAITKVVELNQDHEYSLDRSELIQMLDDALNKQKQKPHRLKK